jgi:hypothetical protein
MPADAERVPFQHVHMEGARFHDGALPLSATSELLRFQNLVEKVARGLFLKEHPERRRVSAKTLGVLGFDLSITRLTDGSVGVDLSVERVPSLLELDDDYAERARLLIEKALGGLAESRSLPDDFPPEFASDLADMGTDLFEGEQFTWSRSREESSRSRAVVTRTTTEPIRQAVNLIPHDSAPVEDLFNAYVVGVCSDPLEFYYKVEGSDRTQTGKFTEPGMFHRLREVCGFANRSPLVALSVLRRPASNQVAEVLNAEALLPPDWAARLEELSQLGPGWLDGTGLAITSAALEVAESFLFRVLDANLPRPGVFPTREGGIQFEWGTGPEELEVVVSGGGSIRVYLAEEDEFGFLGTIGLVFARVEEVLSADALS